uniref:Uncharacterized protein n=1 Tax=Anguilla anguilla TaxID=7936 RepID=A0A0E9VT72_ANGAN
MALLMNLLSITHSVLTICALTFHICNIHSKESMDCV